MGNVMHLPTSFSNDPANFDQGGYDVEHERRMGEIKDDGDLLAPFDEDTAEGMGTDWVSVVVAAEEAVARASNGEPRQLGDTDAMTALLRLARTLRDSRDEKIAAHVERAMQRDADRNAGARR